MQYKAGKAFNYSIKGFPVYMIKYYFSISFTSTCDGYCGLKYTL